MVRNESRNQYNTKSFPHLSHQHTISQKMARAEEHDFCLSQQVVFQLYSFDACGDAQSRTISTFSDKWQDAYSARLNILKEAEIIRTKMSIMT